MTINEEIEEKLRIYNEKLKTKKEIWKVIYVNDIRSNYAISNFGRIKNREKNEIKEWEINPEGRYISWYCKVNDIIYRNTVHRLVALYFCQIPKRFIKNKIPIEKLVVNHKNGIKQCNASFNLEWTTPKENTNHDWKNGLCDEIRGEKNHLSKITEEQAIQICEYIMQKKSNKEIIELMGVSNKTIQHIRSGECWKHITHKYKFPKLGNAKPYAVSNSMIHEICKKIEMNKYTDTEIGEMFNVSRRFVNSIRNKEIRKNISQHYNF